MNILIVDDHVMVRRILARLLTPRGHFVEMCNEGSTALHRLSSGSHDALLADYVMPEMSGIELATRAAAIRPSLRCFVMSGHPEPEETPYFIEWVLKPINIEALVSQLTSG